MYSVVITDGGPNDDDGQLNGIVVDPGDPAGGESSGVDAFGNENPPRFGPRSFCPATGCMRTARGGPRRPGGGGGAADLWFLLMLLGLIAVPVLTRQRKRLTR